MHALHVQPLPDWIRNAFQEAFDSAGIEALWGGDQDDRSLKDLARGADVLITGRRHIEQEWIAYRFSLGKRRSGKPSEGWNRSSKN